MIDNNDGARAAGCCKKVTVDGKPLYRDGYGRDLPLGIGTVKKGDNPLFKHIQEIKESMWLIGYNHVMTSVDKLEFTPLSDDSGKPDIIIKLKY